MLTITAMAKVRLADLSRPAQHIRESGGKSRTGYKEQQ